MSGPPVASGTAPPPPRRRRTAADPLPTPGLPPPPRLRLEEVALPSERDLLGECMRQDLIGAGPRLPILGPKVLEMLNDLVAFSEGSVAFFERFMALAALLHAQGNPLHPLGPACLDWRGGPDLARACRGLLQGAPAAAAHAAELLGLRAVDAPDEGGEEEVAARLAAALEHAMRAWHSRTAAVRCVLAAAAAAGMAQPQLSAVQLHKDLGYLDYVEREFLFTTEPGRQPVLSRLCDLVGRLDDEAAAGLADVLAGLVEGTAATFPVLPALRAFPAQLRRAAAASEAAAAPAPAAKKAKTEKAAEAAEAAKPMKKKAAAKMRGEKIPAHRRRQALAGFASGLAEENQAQQAKGPTTAAKAVAKELKALAHALLREPWGALPGAKVLCLEHGAVRLQQYLQPSLRLETEAALLAPQRILRCSCCPPGDQGPSKHMEDACIVYHLLRDCKDGVAALDWFKDFCAVCAAPDAVEGGAEAPAAKRKAKPKRKGRRTIGRVVAVEDEGEDRPAAAEAPPGGGGEGSGDSVPEGPEAGMDKEEREALLARFLRAVAELQLCGLVRKNPRKRGGDWFAKTILDLGRVF